MKTMTCRQLDGACDITFHAETFDEMAELSKTHGMEIFQREDEAHMQAMKQMGERMSNSEAMQSWMVEKRAEFEMLPEDL